MTRVAGMLKPIISGDFPSLRKRNISMKASRPPARRLCQRFEME